jgi:hypothetical protein
VKLRPAHRARRFFRALVARRPSPPDLEWAASHLSERERNLFVRMSVADRAHSIEVARIVESKLEGIGVEPGSDESRWIIAAALTHDVGKTVAGLGTYGRVMATLSGSVGGRDMGPLWAERRGMTRRIGLYLQYPQLGADLLAMAGSDPRVCAWAAEHHEPEERWTIPVEVGRLLVAADDCEA